MANPFAFFIMENAQLGYRNLIFVIFKCTRTSYYIVIFKSSRFVVLPTHSRSVLSSDRSENIWIQMEKPGKMPCILCVSLKLKKKKTRDRDDRCEKRENFERLCGKIYCFEQCRCVILVHRQTIIILIIIIGRNIVRKEMTLPQQNESHESVSNLSRKYKII